MQSDVIPLVNLSIPHLALEQELTEVFRAALRTGVFTGGPMVAAFEERFAAYCGARFAVAVNSGTDALRFALMASGVRAGDAVITVPNTFIATTEAISQAGALPLFVDVDEQNCTMSPDALWSFLASSCELDPNTGTTVLKRNRTPVRAVVPVHLYGHPADMETIGRIAGQYRLTMVEDACQAHGALCFSPGRSQWLKTGVLGRAAAFSFYPGKNLGGLGEGGAVTTDDEEIAHTISMLRDHGQAKKYHHDIEGYNGRLDAMQAGMLTVKLSRLDTWNRQRRDHADYYEKLLRPLESMLRIPKESPWARSVFHLYVIRVAERDRLLHHLAERGISAGLHYPVPLHLQKAYAGLGLREGSFPVTERLSREILSLPMFPELTEKQQDRIVDSIIEYMAVHA